MTTRCAYPEPAIAERRGEKLLGPLRARRLEAPAFQPALNVQGAAGCADGGFSPYCAVCHQPGPAGQA